ncbi:MAG: hypothetical protein NWE78_03185 [Candidatus Bathyarchaeota archaeon]|nr:hypothetical protein [Candidatus Bathyarchaeota archaeon]
MGGKRDQGSLKRFAKTVERLDLEKQVAACKWLEGVIVAQMLTTDERKSVVDASNQYIEAVEGEYSDAVNALLRYLTHAQKKVNRALKRKDEKPSVKNEAVAITSM